MRQSMFIDNHSIQLLKIFSFNIQTCQKVSGDKLSLKNFMKMSWECSKCLSKE